MLRTEIPSQQLERLYKIDRMLARRRVVPRNRSLEELEISRAPFMRDILRIAYDARSEIAPTEIGGRLAPGFGIFMGSRRAKSTSRRAILRFTPERARWVRDERWHPHQEGTIEADGSYRLELPYENATELVLEILRHGSQVEVLGPPALRETVAEEWRRAAALYSAAPSAKS